VRLIAVAIEEKLPLLPLLESWAADEYGSQQTRLQRLIALLDAGTPLPDALEATPGVVRDEDLLAVRFDVQSGTRTAAMRQGLAPLPAPVAMRLPGLGNSLLYFGVMVVVCLVFLGFHQLSIAPVIEKILSEFSVEKPAVVQSTQEAFQALTRNWGWIAIGVVVALLAFFSRTGRAVRFWIWGWFSAPWRDSLAADVLQKLGIAAASGRPLAAALSTLARYHFDPTMRHKLLFVRNEVEQGADAWESLTAVGLLTPPEVHLLGTARRVGNQPWVISQLVASKQRRTAHRSQRLAVFVLPVVVIVLGAFVLSQALTLFLPLTEMIRSL